MNYIIDKEQYKALKAAWKNRESHSAEEIIAYNILRGFDAKRGFTPIKNQRKIENGLKEWQAFERAKNSLNWMYPNFENKPHLADKFESHKKDFKNQYGIEYSRELIDNIQKGVL